MVRTKDMKFLDYLKKYKWLVIFFVVVAFGYILGKDAALRDNAKDAAAIEAQTG